MPAVNDITESVMQHDFAADIVDCAVNDISHKSVTMLPTHKKEQTTYSTALTHMARTANSLLCSSSFPNDCTQSAICNLVCNADDKKSLTRTV